MSVLGMSDDDFANALPPVVEAADPQPTPEELAAREAELNKGLEEEPLTVEEKKEPVVEEPAPIVPAKVEPVIEEEEEPEPVVPGKPLTDEEQLAAKPPVKPLTDPKLDANGKPIVEEAAPAKPSVTEPAKVIDHKAEYEKLMQPLSANGKKIEIRSPDELIKLAQQGANYTQKMQQLAPHRKSLLMLQNNGIDEDQLDYLIALSKKDPEAIKKLVKDSGINPLDIDTETEPAFKGGSHQVTEEAANFHEMLDNFKQTPEGVATLQVINTWDQASKNALFADPGIADTIRDQKASGVYDAISAEVERYRMLGEIPNNVSFLQAYKQVGDHMVKTGGFAALVEKKEPVPQTPAAPVATRVAAPKPAVSNDEKAKAATASRTTPRQAKVIQNPLEMSDEDFLKQMNGRL